MKNKHYFTLIVLLISNIIFSQTFEGNELLVEIRRSNTIKLKKVSEGKYELKKIMWNDDVLNGSFKRLEIIKDDKYGILKKYHDGGKSTDKNTEYTVKLQELCQYEIGGKKGKCILVLQDKKDLRTGVIRSSIWWYDYDERTESYGGYMGEHIFVLGVRPKL